MAPDDPELAHVPGGGDGQQVPVLLPGLQQEGPGLQLVLESEHGLEIIAIPGSELLAAHRVEEEENTQCDRHLEGILFLTFNKMLRQIIFLQKIH